MSETEHKLSRTLVGVAGEYFVGAELSRRGYIASITLRNTRGVDLLVSNEDASRSVGVQVKTWRGCKREWLLDVKVESFFSDALFYVFVNLPHDGSAPEFFVVPSKIVATHAKRYHEEWLATPGRRGQQHKDNPRRKFHDEEGQYLNRWDLLGL